MLIQLDHEKIVNWNVKSLRHQTNLNCCIIRFARCNGCIGEFRVSGVGLSLKYATNRSGGSKIDQIGHGQEIGQIGHK